MFITELRDAHPWSVLQVSISGQAVVFVVRTLSWSPTAVAGKLTYIAFVLAQVHLAAPHLW